MFKKPSFRLFYAFVVTALLLVTGRNLYRRHQESALASAIENKDEAGALALLRRGVLPKDPANLDNLLTQAITHNEPSVVRILLHKGASPDSARNGDDNSHLMNAAVHCPDAVGLMLDKGAKVNQQVTASGNYVSGSHVENMTGYSALIGAIESHHTAVVRLLLARGANVNPAKGTLPLIVAIAIGDKEVVQILLAGGANVNGRPDDTNPLAFAVQMHCGALVPLLLSAPLTQATRSAGLSAAVTGGDVEMTRLLLSNGIHPSAQSSVWLQAVYAARKQMQAGKVEYAQVFALLRPLGVTPAPTKAELEAQNIEGQTPLLIALAAGDASEAQSLLAQGANVNAAAKDGRTPLMEALTHAPALVPALLNRRANVNAVAPASGTALYQSILTNNVRLACLLLAHGANPNLHTPTQPSLLARARNHGQDQIVALLQQAGAKE